MIRALLAGTKSQTRRIVKPQPMAMSLDMERDLPEAWKSGFVPVKCPYGVPGDVLWVREEFSGPYLFDRDPPRSWERHHMMWYWADGEPDWGDWTRPRPSIHMPRWASRISLRITDVRVERLQDITYEDCRDEGTTCPIHGGIRHVACSGLKQGYRDLWESINGPGSWEANPWVWAVSFEVISNASTASPARASLHRLEAPTLPSEEPK